MDSRRLDIKEPRVLRAHVWEVDAENFEHRLLRNDELCELQRGASGTESLVENPPLRIRGMCPFIDAGQADIDVEVLFVPVRTRRDHIAEFKFK